MQHKRKNRTLGRDRDERRALMRGLSVSLIEHGRIVTTLAKAKELRPLIEKMITTAKKDSVATRRTIASRLGTTQNEAVAKLFKDLAPKYLERPGGYTRIIKMGRTTAGREEAVIELV
ncbi:MAG: ribosomal protein large subunit ribosomal protein [Candidatus Parcubacteria bacterium]